MALVNPLFWTERKRETLHKLHDEKVSKKKIAIKLDIPVNEVRRELYRCARVGKWTEREDGHLREAMKMEAVGRLNYEGIFDVLGGIRTPKQISNRMKKLSKGQPALRQELTDSERASMDVYTAKQCHELFPGRSMSAWKSAFRRDKFGRSRRVMFTPQEQHDSEYKTMEECIQDHPRHTTKQWKKYFWDKQVKKRVAHAKMLAKQAKEKYLYG